MRKGLIFVLGIISFLGINTVSAKEIYFDSETNINEIQSYINTIGSDKVNNSINELIKYYNQNLSSEYSYYFISLYYKVLNVDGDEVFHVSLTSFDNFSDYAGDYVEQSVKSYVHFIDFTYNNTYRNIKQISYDFTTDNLIETYYDIPILTLYSDGNFSYPYNYYYSNFDYYFPGDFISSPDCEPRNSMCLTYLKNNDILYLPSWDDSTKYSIHQANEKFLIEPYYLYDDNSSIKTDTYTTINLNEYAYVALTLKDYNTIPDDNFSLYTNIYVKGQVCITPVYNYGLTERKDILTGTQVEGCGIYSPDFVLDRMYILRDDVKNHAIYYLKPYDMSKENIVKIDSSKFNITYISEENKDNPQVTINGKVYPTIPYDDLTDTSTKSEDEGYVPGVSCSFGDFNCYNQYNPENLFDEVFSSPLELLESVWSAISTIFSLIGEFISLLPVPMQTFLYLSFMIAVVLGLLKIIL